jgi:hypothetical protein
VPAPSAVGPRERRAAPPSPRRRGKGAARWERKGTTTRLGARLPERPGPLYVILPTPAAPSVNGAGRGAPQRGHSQRINYRAGAPFTTIHFSWLLSIHVTIPRMPEDERRRGSKVGRRTRRRLASERTRRAPPRRRSVEEAGERRRDAIFIGFCVFFAGYVFRDAVGVSNPRATHEKDLRRLPRRRRDGPTKTPRAPGALRRFSITHACELRPQRRVVLQPEEPRPSATARRGRADYGRRASEI